MNRPDGMANGPVRSRQAKVLFAVTVAGSMVLAAMAVVTTSRAAFSDTTTNGSNTITAGTVTVTDDDAGTLMYNISNAVPGTLGGGAKCINVTYAGSLSSMVRLHAAVTNTGVLNTDSIAPYVDVDIQLGTGATGGSTFDCTGFSVSPTQLYNTTTPTSTAGTLSVLDTNHGNFTDGLRGWETASTNQVRSYRILMSLQDDDAAQGKNAQVTFTWEAQNNT